MIEIKLSNPPSEVLQRLEKFGADWRESKIPAELRRAGVLGATVAVNADTFRMRIQAARRSPEFYLDGEVVATPNGGSQIRGNLDLSSVNRAMMGGAVLVIGASVWHSAGSVAAVITIAVMSAAIARLNRMGRTASEREYHTLLEHTAIGIPTQPPNDR